MNSPKSFPLRKTKCRPLCVALHRAVLLVALLLSSAALLCAGGFKRHAGVLDATPASATNPVVARILECGIEVTAAELAIYTRQERLPDDPAGPVSLERKRRNLDGLLDEHLLVWWACQEKAEETADFRATMEDTRKMLLREALEEREINSKAKAAGDYQRLDRELRDRLFENADIKVSIPAYDELKELARTLEAVPPENVPAVFDTIPAEKRSRVLSRFNNTVVSIGEVLKRHFRTEPDRRPDLQKREALVGVLKEIFMPELMMAESLALGLGESAVVQEKLQLNRAALLRFYAQDRISERAMERMKERDLNQRLKQWYEAHRKDLYTYKDDEGKEQAFAFDAERERVEADYFEHLRRQARADLIRAARQGRNIQFDEKALADLAILFPVLPPEFLEPSVVVWEGDTQEYLVKPGETNAHFTFRLKNVSTNEVTIHEMHPACECTTIQSPPPPWKLVPGEQRELLATVDLRDKTNSVRRSISIDSSHGRKDLVMQITVPGRSLRK